MTMEIFVWVGAVVAGLTTIAGAWRFGRGAVAVVRRVVHFLDDWGGAPARPGIDARPGVIEQLADHRQRLDAFGFRLENIEVQFSPNGGASACDQLNRIERAVAGPAADEESTR